MSAPLPTHLTECWMRFFLLPLIAGKTPKLSTLGSKTEESSRLYSAPSVLMQAFRCAPSELAGSEAGFAAPTTTPVTSCSYRKTRTSERKHQDCAFPSSSRLSSCPHPHSGQVRRTPWEALQVHKCGEYLQEQSHFLAEFRIMPWNCHLPSMPIWAEEKETRTWWEGERGPWRNSLCLC